MSRILHEAVIFDMDGLLLDTERIARRTFLDACAELGLKPQDDVYWSCVGTNAASTGNILRQWLGTEHPAAVLKDLWDRRYHAEVSVAAVPLKPGAREAVERLAADRMPIAVATSTARPLAELKLANAALLERFDCVVTGDEVDEGKPHPAIYSKAASRLAIAPCRCLAVEDSDNGVKSALAAGMRVIQIPDLVDPSPEVRGLGHLVLGSLVDAQPYMFGAHSTPPAPAPA